jgi:uroporphyrinogen-III synthase
MIPYLIPPLSGLSILVTRPALQSASLNNRLIALGAQVTLLPVIEIISRECQLPGQRYDLLIFISSNAVHHGQAILAAQPQARIAAVGTSTAQALISSGHQVDVTPELAASSEALLNHPLLQTPPARVLIVRGTGGRELLRDTLIARGSQVDVLEVYQRAPVQPETAQLNLIQQQMNDGLIDIVTLTSVEIVHAMHGLMGNCLIAGHAGMLAGSSRIAQAARDLGWQGECVLADSPEESSLITSLTRWHTRARSELIR